MTIFPGSITPMAGTEACASTLPTAIGNPSFKPVRAAIWAVKPPAFVPKGTTFPRSFVVARSFSFGSKVSKKAVFGYHLVYAKLTYSPQYSYYELNFQ